MGTLPKETIEQEELAERVPIIGGALLIVATLAVGVMSFLDGATAGFRVRFPVYLLAGAIVFVGTLLTMRYSPQNETTVLRRAVVVGCIGFALIGLATEAVVYGLMIIAPTLSLYLASALITLCGFVYWSLRNWHAVDNLSSPW